MSTDASPDPTGAVGATAVRALADLEAATARINAERDRLLVATYQGQDPARLVTAVVDGQGVVVTVTFVKTIARHEPAVVEEAIRAAVTAAQQRLGDAFATLVAATAPDASLDDGNVTGWPPAEPGTNRDDAENWRNAGSERGLRADLPGFGGGVLNGSDE